MSEATHTPGPWSVGFTEYDLVCADDGDSAIPYPAVSIVADREDGFNSKNVASVDLDLEDKAEADANARLISAAPDLLEALEMVRDADEDCKKDGHPTIPPAARLKIDRAIAKAAGKEAK
jgi:hypothetical protein